MISIDPVNINFHIPATDPLGREEVLGKLRFLPDHVKLSWRMKGSVFKGGKGELTTIDLPYGEIEHVELVKKWFKIRRIVLRIETPELVKDIPGVDMGRMNLHIDDRSREEAKKLTDLIDFQRSMFILDEHDKRLKAMKDS
ncbi:hypothetical protein JO972_07260 [Verrucomicrobiaceae bacterium 5K15]|uniref:Uncharacterized protein n=1 Tax=Oceaniferula flava TaxID=2800421 RepID=A0AAE2SEB2_9BACT|nr:hypothetical protein [Oceaniferula flavus]MBK1854751.1 hypothetical protein [Oceaniferula flavus]MBM1136057.1 hypothetical protein [Oceaniferula flavus]